MSAHLPVINFSNTSVINETGADDTVCSTLVDVWDMEKLLTNRH